MDEKGQCAYRICIDNAFNFNLLVLDVSFAIFHHFAFCNLGFDRVRGLFNDTIKQQKGHRCNLNIQTFYYIRLPLQTLSATFFRWLFLAAQLYDFFVDVRVPK